MLVPKLSNLHIVYLLPSDRTEGSKGFLRFILHFLLIFWNYLEVVVCLILGFQLSLWSTFFPVLQL